MRTLKEHYVSLWWALGFFVSGVVLQALVSSWLLYDCAKGRMPRIALAGNVGIGTSVPEDPIVVRSTDDATEIYRLRADGTEWYAPGVDRAWIQGLVFQARCPVQARCL